MVMAGKDAGEVGIVTKVIRDVRFPRVVVEGLNLVRWAAGRGWVASAAARAGTAAAVQWLHAGMLPTCVLVVAVLIVAAGSSTRTIPPCVCMSCVREPTRPAPEPTPPLPPLCRTSVS